MPLKLRSKIVYGIQGSIFDVVRAEHEGLVLAMVEQLEKNVASLLQEEHTSNNPIRQEWIQDIGNADVPIHFLNPIEEFQALIEEMRNQSLMTT